MSKADLAPEDLKSEDFVSELFKRTRGKDIAPYKLPVEWELRPFPEQVKYLCKLVSALNDAAQRIQSERNELNTILFSKEKQLTQLQKTVGADRMMIHKQLERANNEHQAILEENQQLYAEIAELTKKLKDSGVE